VPALTTEQVLREEAKAIHGEDISLDPPEAKEPKFYSELCGLDSSALCLSGGGIRSATFALGVIQALAVHPRPVNATTSKVKPKEHVGNESQSLLAQFNYLSTVSGGGYIGSWLSSWLARRNLSGHSSWKPVWESLIGKRPSSGAEPPELSWLRSYSNFLTPKLGVTSADSWAAVALVLRNLLLNWLVILPWLCALLLACDVLAITFAWLGKFNPQSNVTPYLLYGLVVAGGVAQIVALVFLARQRPTSRKTRNICQTEFLIKVLLPIVLAGLLFALAMPLSTAQKLAKDYFSVADWHPFQFYAWMTAIGICLYVLAWLLAWPSRQFPEDTRDDFFAWAASGGVYAVVIGLGINLFSYYVPGKGLWIFEPSGVLLLVAALPWTLLSYLVADMIYVGLTNAQPDSDSDREWLGRASGWILVIAITWLVVTLVVFLGAKLTRVIVETYWPWLTGGGVSVSGVIAWLAKSAFSPARGEAKSAKAISANVILAIAAPVFAIILTLLTVVALDNILFDKPLIESDLFKGVVPENATSPDWPGGWSVLAALVLALAIAAGASYFININRFSLHALYRNRLIRAFLGASNTDRNPNCFTNFDENDNLRCYDLWSKEIAPNQWPRLTPDKWRPFHVINIALNAVSTANLAWQERKAESLTVSALHTGCDGVGYRYSINYGDKKGISVGTAMAISGAAASPNQGYHSSPAMSFLMTMFNVRLGWWLGNPGPAGEKIYQLEGPSGAIIPIAYEMFGQTTDDWKYIYLSDGGHFENLALYEMVRRRCRCIVVSDAGCDPKFEFEDLGNAVRKIAIDFGLKIRFDGLRRLTTRHAGDPNLGTHAPYYSVGTVDYPMPGGKIEEGLILYIKPAFHGTENADIQNYALAHKGFPHESTVDQFFSESQFESYRALGFQITDAILSEAVEHLPAGQPPTLCNLIEALRTEA
jgi:hypothetical protein